MSESYMVKGFDPFQEISNRKPAVSFSLLFFIDLFFCASIFAWVFNPSISDTTYLILILMTLCVIISFFINYKVTKSHITVLNLFLAVYFDFFIVATVLIITGYRPTPLIPDWSFSQMNYALIVTFLFLVFIMNGYVFFAGHFILGLLPNLKNKRLSTYRIKLSIFFMMLASLCTMVLFFHSLGGIDYLLALSRLRVSSKFLGTSIYSVPMVVFANMSVFLSLALKKKRMFWFFPLFFYSFFADLISGYRINIAALLVTVFIILKDQLKMNNLRLRYVLLAIVCLLLIGPVPLALRGGYSSKRFRNIDTQITAVKVFFLKAKWQIITTIVWRDSIEPVMVITSKLSHTDDYQYGKYFFSSLLFGFIPLSIWPKRPPIGLKIIGNYFWPTYVKTALGSPGVTMIGEIYFDGGVVGIVIISCLLGIIFKRAERYKNDCGGNPLSATLYGLVAWYLAGIMNEVFVTSVGSFLIYFAVWSVLSRFVTREENSIVFQTKKLDEDQIR